LCISKVKTSEVKEIGFNIQLAVCFFSFLHIL
jgi:hypothetical protein